MKKETWPKIRKRTVRVKNTVCRFSRNLVKAEAAEKFWRLAPVTEAEVIPFPNAKTA